MQPSDRPKTIYVKRIRKDDKLKVEYVFPVTGKRITKIVTREKRSNEHDRTVYEGNISCGVR